MKRILFTTVVALATQGCDNRKCSPAEWYEKRVPESQVVRAAEVRSTVLSQGYSDEGARFEYCSTLCNPARTCEDPIADGGTMEVPYTAEGGAGGMTSNGGEGGVLYRVEKTYTVECYRKEECWSNGTLGLPGL